MSEPSALEIRGLVKRFGGLTAVDGVDLSIKKGELFSLLGPNGAGKSTVMGILSTRLGPTAGSAAVMGHDVVREQRRVKELIGVVPQETILYDKLNARETLRFFGDLYDVPRAELDKKIKFLLDLVSLTDRQKDLVETYSGGMKRRLNIAASLVHDPQVLFLDEPTTGLDPQSRRALWDLIEGLKTQGKTILLTTHYMEEADVLSDRVAIMDHGKVISLGTPDELKKALGKETVVEVAFSHQPGEAVRKALASVKGVRECVLAGDVVRCLVVDGGRVLPRVVDAASKARVPVARVHVSEPTLEDVFIKLTGKALRE